MAYKYRVQIGYRDADSDYTHVGETAFSRDHSTYDNALKITDFFVDRVDADGSDTNYGLNYSENLLPGSYGAFWGHPEYYYSLIEITNAEYEELLRIDGIPAVSYMGNGKWAKLTRPEKVPPYITTGRLRLGTYDRDGVFDYYESISYGVIGVLNDKSNPEEDLKGNVYIQNLNQKIDDKQASSYSFDTYDFYVNVRGGRDLHVEVAAGTTAYAVAGTNLKYAESLILTHPSTWTPGLMINWTEVQYTDRYKFMWQTRFDALSSVQVGESASSWRRRFRRAIKSPSPTKTPTRAMIAMRCKTRRVTTSRPLPIWWLATRPGSWGSSTPLRRTIS